MDIRILGPTEIRHDGSRVILRGSKPRQLLVLLALRANRPVTSDQLIEELWEGDPPPSASSALRVHLGHLRRVLEPERDRKAASSRLPAGPHGYLLRLEPDELDAERFERKVLAARQANADCDPGHAVSLLTEGLDFWRGQALADVRDLSAARSEMARLDELHAVAFEELADARLALGDHSLVVDVLTSAVAEFPLRDKLTASLMLALYRCGRAPDALHAYAELARQLDHQLGVVPSEALRRLEQDILLQRPALDYTGRTGLARGAPQLHMPPHRTIGRHEELRELVECFQAPPTQRPRLYVLRGPAGIGKSTLVGELGVRVRRKGVFPLVGSCQLHPSAPYEAIAQILRQAVSTSTSADSFGQQRSGPELPDLLSDEMSSSASDSEGPAGRFRHFESIALTLADCLGPSTLIVMEDLHWADRPTLLLLRHLVRHQSLVGMIFVVTYRDDEIVAERLDLIESLVAPCRRITRHLSPFHDGEVRSFVRAIAAPENVNFLVDRASSLRDVTGGNPFFLRELLRELDNGSVKLESDEDLATALLGLAPAKVCALIDRRVERLTGQAKEVISVAATIGEGLSTDLLAEACGLAREALLDTVEECLAARLLLEDPFDAERFHFPHALACNAVYANIPPSIRVELHRKVAAALLSLPGRETHVSTLARHFNEAATMGLYTEAASYCEQAGADANSRFMFSAAATWYERAIRWGSLLEAFDESSHGKLYLFLGRAYANDKQLERARGAFLAAAKIARRAHDWRLLADIALAADGPWSSGSEFREVALPLLEEALERLEDSDAVLRVRLLAAIASELYYVDAEREGKVARMAVELAETLDDPVALATSQLALHRWRTHEPAARTERLALSRSALRRVKEGAPAAEIALPLERTLLADLLENGEVEEFDLAMSDYESAARSLGSPRDIYWSSALRATQATLHGDLVAGDQHARGAALRGHELEQLSEGALILQRFVIRYQQDRLSEEMHGLREASRSETVFLAGAALVATALSETRHQGTAEMVAWDVLGADGSSLPRDIFWLGAVALFSGVAARGQDRSLQQLLHELLIPCRGHVVVFGAGGAVLGIGSQWLGLLEEALGDLDSAVDSLRTAWKVSERISAPYWTAQAQQDASRVLAKRMGQGDEIESANLAHVAVETAESHGFERILHRSPLQI